MQEHWLSGAVDSMSRYEVVDVLSKIGGLLILPENASRIFRLEIAAHAAAAATPSTTSRSISPGTLRSILNNSVISDEQLVMQEDPLGGWLTESVTFSGGPNLVFPGIVSNATFNLRHVLKSIALHTRPFSSPDFGLQSNCLALATLRLSNAIATRAGMARGVLPIERRGDTSIFVPAQAKLDGLAAAVTFSPSELAAVFGNDIELDAIAPLVIDAGNVALSECTPEAGPIQAKPIVRCGDTLVVVAPTLLTAALRHAIVCQAQASGLIHELAERLNGAFWLTLKQSLTHMGLAYCENAWPEERPDLLMADGVFGFDTDKALYACMLTDDLADYDRSTVFGAREPADLWHSIKRRFDHVYADLREMPHAPTELVCLLLTAGVGRSWVFGLGEKGEELHWKLLTLGLADLETISLLEGHDELFLWRFARDSDRARDKIEVLNFGALNEYGFYRQQGYSYYFSDNVSGGNLALDASWEGALHREVLDTIDPHGVHSWDKRHIANVVAAHGTRDVPVYMPRTNADDRVALLVEGYSVPLWVVSDAAVNEQQKSNLPTIALLADAIAYWLWQFTPSLQNWFNRAFGNRAPVFLIRITAAESLELHSDDLRSRAHERGFDISTSVTGRELSVEFRSTVSALINGPTNEGEKILMHSLLVAMRDMAPATLDVALTDAAIDEIIDRHSRPPTKKKMIVMRSDAEPMLDRRGIPRFRKISSSEENVLLDRLGEHLRETKGLPEGRIPDDDRLSTLNAAVAFYFNRLKAQLADLSHDGLLVWLVGQHESTLREGAFWKLVLPTRLACYETEASLGPKWDREHREFMRAGLAARFVIELVTATPPAGSRTIANSVFDEAVAIAAEIVTRGFDSDAIRFELVDGKLSILKSGRLGRAFDSYDDARRAFMAAFSAADVGGAAALFGRHWHDHRDAGIDMSSVDAAAREEFGHTLTAICTHWGAAAGLAADLSPGGLRLPKNEFAEQLAARLSWSLDRVLDVMDRFSLRPRADFFKLPNPYGRRDVYPWVHNREYSYLRRPFLIVLHEGREEVVVGPRHLHQAWRYLVHLCMDGRLQPKSKAMQRFIGARNKERGEAFNDHVADRLAENSGLIVLRRVKKIKTSRGTTRSPENSDIDVLVLDRKQRTAWLIECKDLALARTPREMSQELTKLLKGGDRSRSTIEKHLERAEWVRVHLRDLLANEKLGWSDKWTAKPLIVLENVPPSAYLFKGSVAVLSLEDLVNKLT